MGRSTAAGGASSSNPSPSPSPNPNLDPNPSPSPNPNPDLDPNQVGRDPAAVDALHRAERGWRPAHLGSGGRPHLALPPSRLAVFTSRPLKLLRRGAQLARPARRRRLGLRCLPRAGGRRLRHRVDVGRRDDAVGAPASRAAARARRRAGRAGVRPAT
eukprot:scaffold79378_cov58-Phaeocystis_antarctica.AAC.3